LAYRLEFTVREELGDAAACATILAALREAGERPVILQAAYWQLLARTGQADTARQLAVSETLVPRNPIEARYLLRAYAGLELWDEVDRLAKVTPLVPAWRMETDVNRAQSFIRNAKWDDLRQLADRLRNTKGTAEALGGYPRFLEALAQAAQQDTAAANAGYLETATLGIPEPALALEVAQRLLEAAAPGPAAILLKKHRAAQADNPAFWHLLVRCADALLDEYTLWEAVTQLKRLLPDDPIVENNYAVALAIRREQPEEVVRHTFVVLRRAPENPTVALNHALALILNGRLAEARALLDRVIPSTLTPRDQAQYHIVRYELLLREGNRPLAEAQRKLIDLSLLWPSQRTWLDASLAAAPQPAPPGPAKP
jgi:hypothetical protein